MPPTCLMLIGLSPGQQLGVGGEQARLLQQHHPREHLLHKVIVHVAVAGHQGRQPGMPLAGGGRLGGALGRQWRLGSGAVEVEVREEVEAAAGIENRAGFALNKGAGDGRHVLQGWASMCRSGEARQ